MAEEVPYFLSDSGSPLFVTDEYRFASVERSVRRLRGVRTLLVDGAAREGADSLPDRLAHAQRVSSDLSGRRRRRRHALLHLGDDRQVQGGDDHAPESGVEYAGPRGRLGMDRERRAPPCACPVPRPWVERRDARKPVRRLHPHHARVGLNLFVINGIAPDISFREIMRVEMPFIVSWPRTCEKVLSDSCPPCYREEKIGDGVRLGNHLSCRRLMTPAIVAFAGVFFNGDIAG